MRIEQPGDGDTAPHRLDASDPDAAGGPEEARGTTADNGDAAARTERVLDHRARVDAAYRGHAIEAGCARVEQIERETVTPAMQRIEGADSSRHLAGFKHRLKGRDRLSEKVTAAIIERARTPEQALATVKDAVRYTFCYPEDRYTVGVYADCDRLQNAGFERVERRNSWSHEEYKGVNSRWRVPDSRQIFEVQFHTQASYEAKQQTHWAYEKLRAPDTSKAEQEEMAAYQRKVTARVPVPPDATGIPDYRYS